MKTVYPIPIALVAAAVATAPAHAAKTTKLPADWKAVAKTGEGRTITLAVVETGDIGLVATDAPYAVVPVVAANADDREMPEIPVLVAPDKIAAFLKAAAPVKTGGRTSFGDKVKKGTFTGTFVTLAGEPAIVVGDVKPAMKLKKPSEVLAAQRAAAKKAGAPETDGDVTVVERSDTPVRRDPGKKAR